MKLYSGNRRTFKQSLPEVLENFYSIEEIWGIACEQVYPFLSRSIPNELPKKVLLIELLLEVVNTEALTELLESLPAEGYILFNQLVWEGDQELDSLEAELGFEITEQRIEPPQYHDEDESISRVRKPGYWWIALEELDTQTAHSDLRVMVRLPPAVRSRFMECMPKPTGYNLDPLESLPEGLKTFRCDDTLAEDLRVVSNYITRGHLEYTKAESIKKPCIRVLEKLTEGGEFFPGDKTSAQLPFLRHELLTNIVASMGESLRGVMLQDPPTPERLLRPLCSALFRHPEWFLEYVLTHLSGGNTLGGKEVISFLKALFSRLSNEHWISMSNLERYVHYREIDINPVSYHRCYMSVEPYMEDYCEQNRVALDASNSWDLVVVPLLKGTAFLLAALGFAEIAYSTPPENSLWKRKADPFLTPYDGCFAIRLTPLGAYVFGLTNEVELKISEHTRPDIRLNPKRLTVICRNLDPITELSLLDFMEKISEGCFRMTRQTLLRRCSSSSQVVKRVADFKEQVSDDLPELWDNFLNTMIETAGALSPKEGYTVYELVNNPELRRLFISDPILREKALKVEGMRVAIKTEDVSVISRRLNALGYLMQ
ncbi:MAG: hypothetical protein V5783_08395 [Pontiella sp.]